MGADGGRAAHRRDLAAGEASLFPGPHPVVLAARIQAGGWVDVTAFRDVDPTDPALVARLDQLRLGL